MKAETGRVCGDSNRLTAEEKIGSAMPGRFSLPSHKSEVGMKARSVWYGALIMAAAVTLSGCLRVDDGYRRGGGDYREGSGDHREGDGADHREGDSGDVHWDGGGVHWEGGERQDGGSGGVNWEGGGVRW
jgi:hypothetical protein